MKTTNYQSTDRLCPGCNTSDTDEEDFTHFQKDRWLLVCENCQYCPERVSRTPTTDNWKQFWKQREERDGRIRPVGGWSQAY